MRKFTQISDRIQRVSPSLARDLFNKAKLHDNVVDLTLGDPDFATPERIRRAGIQAIADGHTHYSANAGMAAARQSVGRHIKRVWGVDADPDTDIILTVGGMEALFLTLAATVNPGDEVVIFAPYYVNYIQMVRFLGGVPVVVNTYERGRGISIDADTLRRAVTPRTAAVIVNSPSNPTGDAYSRQSLAAVAQVAEESGMLVIADEVYRTLLFDGIAHESILQFADVRPNVVLIDSLSKEFSMTGWRIGYAYGDRNIIANMVKLQENVAACAALPSQHALVEAYDNYVPEAAMLAELQRRRDYLVTAVNATPALSCVSPKGTFYLWVNIEDTGLDGLTFAYRLLEQEQVAVVPGITYGEAYAGYIRIAFTKDIATLTEAMCRIRRFVQKGGAL